MIRLQQTNTEVAIPFALSSRGYGFLWNNPAIGRVEFGENLTRWVAEGTRVLDYYVVAGETPAQIIEAYVSATGRPPLLPQWSWAFGSANYATAPRRKSWMWPANTSAAGCPSRSSWSIISIGR